METLLKHAPSVDKRMHALVNLMRWSGLSIRDAVTLERSRLDCGLVELYRAKTGTPVTVAIPPDIANELHGLSPVDMNKRYFFWNGRGKVETVVGHYHAKFAKLFAKAALREPDNSLKKVRPHMLRDTFSVNLLLVGVLLHDVSLLLGHSSVKTTERHYSPFVMARRESLIDAVTQAWPARGAVEEI
jgi:integrase/recombinase XerD